MAWIIVGIIIVIIVIRVVYELHHLKVTAYSLKSQKLKAADHFRIVFLSDLHLRKYGQNNEFLIDLIRSQSPDFILLGGDMTIDSAKKSEASLFPVLKGIAQIAPTFYAPGNHERVLKENERFQSDRFEILLEKCREYGIEFLSNRSVAPTSSAIRVIGFDPEYTFYDKRLKRALTKEDLTERIGHPDPEVYKILLAHDPGPFEEYVKYGADLILSGHYHGGAIRFGKAGLVSPQVRFFPKYSAGKFEKDGCTMIVTKGAGSHSVNLRLFNYPEIVKIELTGTR